MISHHPNVFFFFPPFFPDAGSQPGISLRIYVVPLCSALWRQLKHRGQCAEKKGNDREKGNNTSQETPRARAYDGCPQIQACISVHVRGKPLNHNVWCLTTDKTFQITSTAKMYLHAVCQCVYMMRGKNLIYDLSSSRTF